MIGSKLVLDRILSAPPDYGRYQKCNVPQSAWSFRVDPAGAVCCRPTSPIALLPSATRRPHRPPSSAACLAPCRPPRPRTTPPRAPRQPALYTTEARNERHARLVSLVATPQRAIALAPILAASPHVRHASLSTEHPFIAQQQPLQLTLSRTPPSGPVFIIFSRPALPLSPQQS